MLLASPALAQDTDGDGLTDADETGVHGTDPSLADTDGDGVGDYDEAIRFPTDPLDFDSDDDGLFDGQESLTPSGFALPVLVATELLLPEVAGDVDGDGDLDLVFSEPYPAGSVRLVEVSPTGTSFGASQPLTDDTLQPCHRALLEDVDDDGDLDVVRSEEYHLGPPTYASEYGLRIIENRLDEPSNDFALPTTLAGVTASRDARFVDLDGDGRRDLWQHSDCHLGHSATVWSKRSSVLGPIAFDATQVLSPVIDWYQTPDTRVLADLDGDVDPDLVWIESNELRWSENRLDEPSADFGPTSPIVVPGPTVYEWQGLRVVQIDDTPLPEIAVWGPSLVEPVELWLLPNPIETRPASAAPLPAGPVTGFFANIGIHPVELDFADIDGDGDQDLLSTLCYDAYTKGTCGPSSVTEAELVWIESRFDEPAQGWGPRRIIDDGTQIFSSYETQTRVLDLDGDGDLDVLEASGLGLRYFENVRHLGSDPLSSDTDGDGLPDLEEVAWETDPTRVDTDGDGLRDGLEVGVLWTDPKAPDTDGDGLLDGQESAIAGGPLDVPRPVYDVLSPYQFDLDLSDLDGDGDRDVVAIGLGYVDFLENRLTEPAGDLVSWLGSPQPFGGPAEAAFLSGDPGPPLGLLEDGGANLRAWLGFGGPGLPLGVGRGAGASGERIHIVDFDDDGDPDVMTGPSFAGLIQWNENHLADPEASIVFAAALVDVSALGSVTDWHPADLDGDDDLDVIVVEQTTNGVWWFENRLDEVSADFGPAQTVATGGDHSGRVTAGDIDGDGDLDPIVTSFRGNEVTWLENRLSQSLPFVEHLAGNAGYLFETRLLSEDLNADGYADIVLASSQSDFDSGAQEIRIFWSGGPVIPITVQLIETGGTHGGGDVIAADLDDDGDLDLLATSGDEMFFIPGLANLGTDPHDPDSDDDGFLDGVEVERGSDPNDPASVPFAVPLGAPAALVLEAVLVAAFGVAALRGRLRA